MILVKNRFFLFAACILTIVALTVFIPPFTANPVVVKVGSFSVRKDEFLFFMQKRRAETASYFQRQYGLEFGKDFWETKIDGTTPLEYIKTETANEIARIKAIQALALKYKIADDVSFKSILAEFNATGGRLMEEGEIFSMQFYRFYDYYISNLEIAVKNKVIENEVRYSESDLLSLYEETKQNYVYPKIEGEGETDELKSFEEVRGTVLNLYSDRAFAGILSETANGYRIRPMFLSWDTIKMK